SLEATVAQACAIARHTEPDPAAGLADAGLMARPGPDGWPDFDDWHPWPLEPDRAVDLALACEAAGREGDARITNSDGASVSSSASLAVYANSHGFVGAERGTHHSIGCALIAGRGEAMQRDGWYSYALAADDLEPPAAVGRRAAERAVPRLQPRPVATGSYPVLFCAGVAGRRPARRGVWRRAVPRRELPARQRRHPAVPCLVLDPRGAVPAPRPAFGGLGRRGRGHPRLGTGGRRRAAALRAGQLFGP